MIENIELPKYDGGYFPCIIDTQPNFQALFDYIDETYAQRKKYIIIHKSL